MLFGQGVEGANANSLSLPHIVVKGVLNLNFRPFSFELKKN